MRTWLLTGLLLASTAWARPAGRVEHFIASYQGTSVRLDWRVAGATDRGSFEIFRKKPTEEVFVRLAELAANGSSTYTFTDDNLYRDQTNPQSVITYRLVMRADATQESHHATVEHNPTAVQRSWGSIKMMFR